MKAVVPSQRLVQVASHVVRCSSSAAPIYGATGDTILSSRLDDCHDDLSCTIGPPLASPPPLQPLPVAALLDDLQVQDFVTKGFLLVDVGDGGSLHRNVVERLDCIRSRTTTGRSVPPEWAAEPSGGVPDLRQVFDSVPVRGALTSLLGPGYMLNPHHHIHLRAPGAAAQGWHKDAFVFDNNIRQPRYQWVFVLYYPNDVIAAGGPTALQPGRHYYTEVSNPDPTLAREAVELLTVPAGTVAIVDFSTMLIVLRPPSLCCCDPAMPVACC